ncbi:MAG: hypothetical protein ACLU06_01430 [Eggerthellaceae bacterium]
MKALSLTPDWAIDVLLGYKMVECRTWKTDYRGPLLICASSQAWPGSIAKHALCVVDLVDIVPFAKKHLNAACMDAMPKPGSFAWILENLRWVKPFEVKGKLHLYDVPDEKIEFIPAEIDNATALKTYYEPLMTWSNREIKEEEVRAWWNDELEAQRRMFAELSEEAPSLKSEETSDTHNKDEKSAKSDKDAKSSKSDECDQNDQSNQTTKTTSPNDVLQISFDEICKTMELVLREKGALSAKDLIRATARKCGYKRLGSRIEEVFNNHLREAVKQGIFTEQDGIILLSFGKPSPNLHN